MKSFAEYIRDADATLELKLSLPIDNRDVESMLRQKVIANNSLRTASLKKKTAKRIYENRFGFHFNNCT
jgi:hypothetical protein